MLLAVRVLGIAMMRPGRMILRALIAIMAM
jgi:hypothetical protein